MDDMLQLPAEAVKAGYLHDEENGCYLCLLCGDKFEEGEIFPQNGRYFDALRAVRLHIENLHGGMFAALSAYGKKNTGVTETQKQLLILIHNGFTDAEIAKEAGVASSTVRHQKFVLREKARQAKLFLALYELAAENNRHSAGKRTDSEDLIEIHGGATMVDDRYEITKSEEEKILSNVFESLEPLKLKILSSKEKKKIVTLKRIVAEFEKGRRYTEKEVNEILRNIYDDYATVRRYLIEYGYMEREKDCSAYWIL